MLSREQLLKYRNDIISYLANEFILENGKPIKLEAWQKEEILKPIFHTKDERGLRLCNLALIIIPKKNGKSTLSAGVGQYMLLCDEPGGEVYSIAGDKDQARIIFDKAKKGFERNPLLRSSVKIYKDAIEVPFTGSFYKVLSADAPTAHGLNPSCVLGDEVWNQPNRDLWDALTTSPVRKQPLYFVTSYPGYDFTCLLYQLYEEALKGKDRRMFLYHRERNLASWVTEEYLEQQRMRLPAHVFQRLHEAKWTEGEGAFLTKEDVDPCINSKLSPRLTGEDGQAHILALDLGLKRDRTCAVILHKDFATGKVILDQIQIWQGSRDDPVLLADIEEFLESSLINFYIAALVVDPWQAQSLIQNFSSRGYNVVEFTFSGSNLTKLTQNLYFLIHNGLFEMFDDKGLKEELLQVNAVEKSYGFRIDHESGRFSDRVIALGMASLEAVKIELTGPVYEEHYDLPSEEEMARLSAWGLGNRDGLDDGQF